MKKLFLLTALLFAGLFCAGSASAAVANINENNMGLVEKDGYVMQIQMFSAVSVTRVQTAANEWLAAQAKTGHPPIVVTILLGQASNDKSSNDCVLTIVYYAKQ